MTTPPERVALAVIIGALAAALLVGSVLLSGAAKIAEENDELRERLHACEVGQAEELTPAQRAWRWATTPTKRAR